MHEYRARVWRVLPQGTVVTERYSNPWLALDCHVLELWLPLERRDVSLVPPPSLDSLVEKIWPQVLQDVEEDLADEVVAQRLVAVGGG